VDRIHVTQYEAHLLNSKSGEELLN